MPKRPVIFRQGDLTRALKGAAAAGLKPTKVEIDSTGKIIVDFSEPPAAPTEPASPFDAWKAKRDASAA